MPAHLKRKRPEGGPEVAAIPAPTTSRRATRQSSIPPLPVPQDPEPRRRRRRPEANGQPDESLPVARFPRGKENVPVHPEQQHQRLQNTKQMARMTRHSVNQGTVAPPRPHKTSIHHAKPTAAIASFPHTNTMAVQNTQRPVAPSRTTPTNTAAMGRSGSRPSTNDPFIPHQQSVSLGRNKPIIMTTSVAQAGQNTVLKLNGTPDGSVRAADNAGRTDRNIDKVMLGDICFRAWYPSYYGKEVLGDISGSSTKGGKDAKSQGIGTATQQHHGSNDDTNGGKAHGRRDHSQMLDRLYVCPCCFKYSKELVTWWEHVRWCEQRGVLPGNKIYTHPKGKRTVLVPAGPVPKQGRGKRGSVGQKMVEEVVQDEGEWSIWEVDGENEVLFCQNLSLFAKLFLDNKSVFFDVTGFNYFLLVYTAPTPPPSPDGDATTRTQPRSQIVGFFSKEKLSWDNNNLACILIFPPWQRKGLGALLMGISYEISRREGLLGGPEKPISDLGKKGYKRFWAGEIARWLLSLSPQTPPTPTGSETEDTQQQGDQNNQDETVIDINHISQATWIAPEDCLLVLREMGLAEDAGTGPPPAPAARLSHSSKAEDSTHATTTNEAGAGPGTTGVTAAAATSTAAAAADQVMVPRVRISQAAVRAWVAANRISLERACDPDGFVEGYALKEGGFAGVEETG